MLSTIAQAIDIRRPLGTRVAVSGPAYQGITVVAHVHALPHENPDQLQENILNVIEDYLSPLPTPTGAKGWPLGRTLRLGELHAVIAAVDGVDAIEKVEMYPADLTTGERSAATQHISLEPTALFLPYRHHIAIATPTGTGTRRKQSTT